jgi:hypothetical protein
VTSKFTGFDDDDDNIKAASSSVVQPQHISSDAPDPSKESLPLQESPMDVDSQPGAAETVKNRHSRKRRSPPSDKEDEAQLMDSILPGATAMKRRRIQKGREGSEIPSSAAVPSKESRTREISKTKAQEIDIKKASRGRLEAAEEAARQDEESYNMAFGGEDVASLRNLAIVEDMEVKARPDHPTREATRGEDSERWDERWNGRKNFKKFRRQGVPVSTGSRVIVGLEEVKKRGYGIGEEYWIGDNTTQQKEKQKQRETAATRPRKESRESSPLFIHHSPSQLFQTAPSQALEEEQEQEQEEAQEQETGDNDTKDIDSASRLPPRPTRASRNKKTTPSKRPAIKTFAKPAAAKKQKRFGTRDSGSDDSDDGMRFRFKKKS